MFLNGEPNQTSYETVAEELGVSSGSLRTAAYRFRRKYRKLLRAQIAETVSSPEETDAEIRFLLSTLNV
jgi:hypothetical protein